MTFTVWFSTFVMHFHTTRSLLHETLKDQWYAVAKVYSEALPSPVFQVVDKSNQELGFRPDHKGHIREHGSQGSYAIGGTQSHKKAQNVSQYTTQTDLLQFTVW